MPHAHINVHLFLQKDKWAKLETLPNTILFRKQMRGRKGHPILLL